MTSPHTAEYTCLLDAALGEGVLPPGASAARKEGEQGSRKLYSVRGSSFLVDNHYEVLSAIGHGAYGVVCAAVDLRLVGDSPHFCPALIENEEKGLTLLRTVDTDGCEQVRQAKPLAQLTPSPGGGIKVPNLRFQPYERRTLGGRRSPLVAIKKVTGVFNDLVDARRVVRETKVLRHLQGHPNVVRILDLMLPCDTGPDGNLDGEFNDVYVVTELMDTNLHAYLRSGAALADDQFRYIAYQLVKALVFTHSSGVIHRDLKPGNVLLNADCSVRVCDFGISRGGVPVCATACTLAPADEEMRQFVFSASPPIAFGVTHPATDPHANTQHPFYSLTDYVVTRYFRAPELLVMSRYNHAVDVWSLGCVLGEMVVRKPLFPGSNYLSQLALIAETPGLQGLPQTEQECMNLFDGGEEGKHLLWRMLSPSNAAVQKSESLRSALFGSVHLSAGFMDLLSRLLAFDPKQRPTAVQILRDPFFADLYSPADEIVRSPDPDVFNQTFDRVEDVGPANRPPSVLVEDADDPATFPWALDHKVVDLKTLQGLFRAETTYYRERKSQLGYGPRRSGPSAAHPRQVPFSRISQDKDEADN